MVKVTEIPPSQMTPSQWEKARATYKERTGSEMPATAQPSGKSEAERKAEWIKTQVEKGSLVSPSLQSQMGPNIIAGKEVSISPGVAEKLGLISKMEAETSTKTGTFYITTPPEKLFVSHFIEHRPETKSYFDIQEQRRSQMGKEIERREEGLPPTRRFVEEYEGFTVSPETSSQMPVKSKLTQFTSPTDVSTWTPSKLAEVWTTENQPPVIKDELTRSDLFSPRRTMSLSEMEQVSLLGTHEDIFKRTSESLLREYGTHVAEPLISKLGLNVTGEGWIGQDAIKPSELLQELKGVGRSAIWYPGQFAASIISIPHEAIETAWHPAYPIETMSTYWKELRMRRSIGEPVFGEVVGTIASSMLVSAGISKLSSYLQSRYAEKTTTLEVGTVKTSEFDDMTIRNQLGGMKVTTGEDVIGKGEYFSTQTEIPIKGQTSVLKELGQIDLKIGHKEYLVTGETYGAAKTLEDTTKVLGLGKTEFIEQRNFLGMKWYKDTTNYFLSGGVSKPTVSPIITSFDKNIITVPSGSYESRGFTLSPDWVTKYRVFEISPGEAPAYSFIPGTGGTTKPFVFNIEGGGVGTSTLVDAMGKQLNAGLSKIATSTKPPIIMPLTLGKQRTYTKTTGGGYAQSLKQISKTSDIVSLFPTSSFTKQISRQPTMQISGQQLKTITGQGLMLGQPFKQITGRGLKPITSQGTMMGQQLKQISGQEFKQLYGQEYKQVYGQQYKQISGQQLKQITGSITTPSPLIPRMGGGLMLPGIAIPSGFGHGGRGLKFPRFKQRKKYRPSLYGLYTGRTVFKAPKMSMGIEPRYILGRRHKKRRR